MQDEAYARLLSNLDRAQLRQISHELRSDILTYFGGLSWPKPIKKDKMEKNHVEWKKVPQEVEELKSLPSDSKLAEAPTRTFPSSEGGFGPKYQSDDRGGQLLNLVRHARDRI